MRAPTVAAEKVRARRAEAVAVLPEVLGLDAEHNLVSPRRRQRGSEQYTKLAAEQVFPTKSPKAACDSLSISTTTSTSGPSRSAADARGLRELVSGRRFPTCSATPARRPFTRQRAALPQLQTVDLSRTYLDWARRKPRSLKRLAAASTCSYRRMRSPGSPLHRRALGSHIPRPPTFSNSKAHERHTRVQRDHAALIAAAARLLGAGGTLVFATNFSRFRTLIATRYPASSPKTSRVRPSRRDFERNPRIHRCWLIRARTIG